MKGFIGDIEGMAESNRDFRRVLYTGPHMQLVLMTLEPGEEIGEEVHASTDQFFRVEEGRGEVSIDGVDRPIEDDFAIVVPAGAKHNIRNTGKRPLRLYTLYAPPQHADGTVHHTRAEAESSVEYFAGQTTE
ncbi:MAG TPA: cupin domain-containing protein [Gemmatimonadaceae bacterium]|nr:cupin domain-containing protein [Gemmatimonadaceae bacterium]